MSYNRAQFVQIACMLRLVSPFSARANERTNDRRVACLNATRKTMVAHPLTMSRICIFCRRASQVTVGPWSTTIDIPFIIAGVKDPAIIMGLHYCMRIPYGDLVLRKDSVFTSILNQRSVVEATTPWGKDTVAQHGEGASRTARRIEPDDKEEASTCVLGPNSRP